MITAKELPSFNIALPAISENALKIHYEQHYLKYIENLNSMLKGLHTTMSIEQIVRICTEDSAMYNTAAQVFNHEFFFEQFICCNEEDASDDFQKWLYINHNMTFSEFIRTIKDKANKMFGSGYVWVFLDSRNRLSIHTMSNARTPIFNNWTPLLCIDLWEHSYYVDYQSNRTEYVSKVLDAINWNVIVNRIKK